MGAQMVREVASKTSDAGRRRHYDRDHIGPWPSTYKNPMMSALIDTQTRKLRAQLLGAMVRREAGEPAPQRLHFRRSVEPEEAAERGRTKNTIA